jgi:glycerol-3-phosphate cytidylyltransferase-like family protein
MTQPEKLRAVLRHCRLLELAAPQHWYNPRFELLARVELGPCAMTLTMKDDLADLIEQIDRFVDDWCRVRYGEEVA